MARDLNGEIFEFVKQRNEALSKLDLVWARAQFPADYEISTETLLVALHKARYEAMGISVELKEESRLWLQERGLSRHQGIPWPEE